MLDQKIFGKENPTNQNGMILMRMAIVATTVYYGDKNSYKIRYREGFLRGYQKGFAVEWR